jgi:hypothetical protein
MYLPKSKYKGNKHTNNGDFITGQKSVYRGWYFERFDGKYFTGKQPGQVNKEIFRFTDVVENYSPVQLQFTAEQTPPTDSQVELGSYFRYFLQDKRNKKIIEVSKAKFESYKEEKYVTKALVPWILKSPSYDVCHSGYTYRGSAYKNEKSINQADTIMPGLKTHIKNYSKYITDPDRNNECTEKIPTEGESILRTYSEALSRSDFASYQEPVTTPAEKWTPTDEWSAAELTLWLDPSEEDWKTGNTQDYVTFNTIPDPDRVSQIDDRSGNANNGIQTTTSRQPIVSTYNSQRVLSFNSDSIELPTAVFPDMNAFSVFIFLKNSNTTGLQLAITAQNNNGNDSRIYLGTTETIAYARGGGQSYGDSGNIETEIINTVNGQIIAATGGSGTISSYVNAGVVETGTFVNSGISKVTLGAYRNNVNNTGNYLIGELGDVIVVTGVVTESARNKAIGYLAWKYGSEGVLPGDFIYKNTYPAV